MHKLNKVAATVVWSHHRRFKGTHLFPAVTTAVIAKGLKPPYTLTRTVGLRRSSLGICVYIGNCGDEEKPAWDKSGACKNILRDCCEIRKTHLLGIEFLMTLNENGAVKVFRSCANPTFNNPTETLRRRRRVVKGRANGTMWKSHFTVLY